MPIKCHLRDFFWSRQDLGLLSVALDTSIDDLLDCNFTEVPLDRPAFMLLPGINCPFMSPIDCTCKAYSYAPLYCLSEQHFRPE